MLSVVKTALPWTIGATTAAVGFSTAAAVVCVQAFICYHDHYYSNVYAQYIPSRMLYNYADATVVVPVAFIY
eukprot:15387-Heterococcus_DN1.PRE.1